MSKIKKIIKAENGFQNNPLGYTPGTPITPVSNKRVFKVGSSDVDLDDKFYKELEQNIISQGKTGNEYADIINGIKNGSILGINAGGNFYGTDLQGMEKDTRRNRAWNMGRKDIIARQDAGKNLAGYIQSIVNKPAPVAPVVEKPKLDTSKYDYSASSVLNNYGYKYGGFNPNTFKSLNSQERLKRVKEAISGYTDFIKQQPAYDDRLKDVISEQSFNNLKNNRDSILKGFDNPALIDKKGNFNIAELDNIARMSGIDLSSILANQTAVPTESGEATASPVQSVEAAKEKAVTEKMNQLDSFVEKQRANGLELIVNPDGKSPEEIEKIIKDPRSYRRGSYNSANEFKGAFEYVPYEEWNPYSSKEKSGYWIGGIKIADDKVNNKSFLDARPQLRDAINRIKQSYANDRFSLATMGNKYRYTTTANNLFKSNRYMNIANLFNKNKNSLYAYANPSDPYKTNYKMYINGNHYDGDLVKGLNNSVLFRYLNNGKNVDIDLGEYNNDITKASYDIPDRIYGQKLSIYKHGGSIKKLQFGGGYKGDNAERIKQHNYLTEQDRNRTATTNEMFDKNAELTAHDKLQLGALIADMGSLGLAFVPGASAASGVVGAGSSLATLGADISRDGLDWGDVGSAALNLGLDAATFIPGVGAGAKAAKIAKGIKKSSKYIRGAFVLGGLTNGVAALNKLEEKGVSGMTLDDWQQLMSGLQSTVMGGRHAINRLGSKPSNPKFGLKLGGERKFLNSAETRDAFIRDKFAYDKAAKTKNTDIDTPENIKIRTDLEAKYKDNKDLNIQDEMSTGIRWLKGRWIRQNKKWASPIYRKPTTANTYEISDRAIRDKGEGKWYNRAAAGLLRYKNPGNRTRIRQGEQTTAAEPEVAVRTATPEATTKPVEATTAKPVEATPVVEAAKPVGTAQVEATPVRTETDAPTTKAAETKVEPKAEGEDGVRPKTPEAKEAATGKKSYFDALTAVSTKSTKKSLPKKITGNYNYKPRQQAEAKKPLPEPKAEAKKGLETAADKAKSIGKKIELDSRRNADGVVIQGKHSSLDQSDTGRYIVRPKSATGKPKAFDNKEKAEAYFSRYEKSRDRNTMKKPLPKKQETTGTKEEPTKKPLPAASTKAETGNNTTTKVSGKIPPELEKDDVFEWYKHNEYEIAYKAKNGKYAVRNKRKNSSIKVFDKKEDALSYYEQNKSSKIKLSKIKRKALPLRKDRSAQSPNESPNSKRLGGIIYAEGGITINANGNTKDQNYSFINGSKNNNSYFEKYFPNKGKDFSDHVLINIHKQMNPDVPVVKENSNSYLNGSTKNVSATSANVPKAADFNSSYLEANNNYDIEKGKQWKKIYNTVTGMASPANARFVNTIVTNNKMMGMLEDSKRPVNNDPIRLNRLSNTGISSIQPQLSDINAAVNNRRNISSNAALNTAMMLSKNAEGNKMRLGYYDQLGKQNQAINQSNLQLSNQETMTNAQIAQQNNARQEARDQWLLSNKLGLVNSNANALNNRLLESEKKGLLNKNRLEALEDAEANMKMEDAYNEGKDLINSKWENKAKAENKSFSDYMNNLDVESKNAYRKELTNYRRKSLLEQLRNKKARYMKSGGSLTFEEKKEIEYMKAKNKSYIEYEKAFNKMVLENNKMNDKKLDGLSKDLKLKIKNIFK